MSTESQPSAPKSAVFSCEVQAEPGTVRVLPVGDLDMAVVR